MKKNMILIMMVFLAMMASSVSAEKTDVTNELADSLVWKITGQGLTEPSYLAGTIHLMCAKDYSLDERYQNAINNSKQLYLEIDFDDPTDMEVMQKAAFVDKSLKERLSAKQYQQFSDFLETHSKLKINMLDKMSFIAIQSSLLMSALNCPIKSVDIELMTMAKSSGQEVYGLETAQQQIDFSEVFTPEIKPEGWTDEELNYFIGAANSFDEMLAIYQQQDINELHHYITSEMSQVDNSEEVIDIMLDNRNQNWVKKMPAIMKSQPTFFAVGSGHLAGEFGVINLLRQAGYTVIPVM